MKTGFSVLRWIAGHFVELIAGIALFIAIFMAAGTTATRYILHWTYGGADEVQCICFSWVVFLGAAYVYREKGHFGIDLVVSLFSPRIRSVLKVIAQIIILAIMITLTLLSIRLVSKVGGKIWPYLGVSYVISDLPLVIGFFMMSVYAARFLIEDIRTLVTSGWKEETKND